LDDARMLLADRTNVHRNQTELYEKTISELRAELDASAAQVKSLKEKISEPSSLLLHLQKELLDVKVNGCFALLFYIFC
jgi:phage shock protein A